MANDQTTDTTIPNEMLAGVPSMAAADEGLKAAIVHDIRQLHFAPMHPEGCVISAYATQNGGRGPWRLHVSGGVSDPAFAQCAPDWRFNEEVEVDGDREAVSIRCRELYFKAEKAHAAAAAKASAPVC